MGVYDNNFLQDYSGVNAAGSAVQGFIKGMNDMDDRKMKQQEFQAKMAAMQTQTQRDALNQKIDMYKNNVAQADDGSIASAPVSPLEHQNQALKAATAGQISTGQDAQGYDTGYKMDPEQIKAKQMEAQMAMKNAMMMNGNQYKDRAATDREDRMAQQIHQKTLNAINNNPQMQQRTAQFQNLDNALSAIVQADHVTPQQVMEFQQSVRSNMGLKGSSTGGEREDTFFKTMGMNAANMKQFLTGDPATLAKDSPLMEHFKQLASVEQGNISKQYDKALMAAAAGHASFYRKNPELLEDLKDKISAQRNMMTSQNLVEAPKPEGLVQPQGFLGRLGGLLTGSPATASAPVPAPHPEDDVAIKWATQNKNSQDPATKQKAALILKANGG